MREQSLQEAELFDMYVMYELIYEQKIKNKLGKNAEFPKLWYRNNNYNEKIEILKEAINNDENIVDTERYNEFVKKIHYSKFF